MLADCQYSQEDMSKRPGHLSRGNHQSYHKETVCIRGIRRVLVALLVYIGWMDFLPFRLGKCTSECGCTRCIVHLARMYRYHKGSRIYFSSMPYLSGNRYSKHTLAYTVCMDHLVSRANTYICHRYIVRYLHKAMDCICLGESHR